MKHTFSVREALEAGWDRFELRPLFTIGLLFITMAVAIVASWGVSQFSGNAHTLMSGVDFLFEILIGMGMTYMFLNVYDKKEEGYDKWFTPLPKFFKYLIANVLMMVAIIIGFLLLIIPGFIVMISLLFVPYLVIDKGMYPIEALKKSWSMATGHRWKLALFMCTIFWINIFGLLTFIVGLFVTVPVTALATIHVYRTLLKTDE